MTARQLLNGVVIELNKQQAPSPTLEAFNYFANKAINQYINKRYSQGYDVNQQFTDDVRVLKASAVLYAKNNPISKDVTSLKSFLTDAKYDFDLPADYLHLLNCTCVYKVNKRYSCYDAGTYWEVGATRLTADLAPIILNNFYMRPKYDKPYYYINNNNVDTGVWDIKQSLTPTNPVELTQNDISGTLNNNGTDRMEKGKKENGPKETRIQYQHYKITGDGDQKVKVYELDSNGNIKIFDVIPNSTDYPFTEPVFKSIEQKDRTSKNTDEFIDIKDQILPRFRKERDGLLDDTVERSAGNRYGNASKVRLEIRYGKDNSVFQLAAIKIDYIKAPQHIRLTQEQIDLTEDTSQILEFPDYVCQEIINELTHIIMENGTDPRLQTHPVVSQSIASPAQGQTSNKK